MPHASRGWTRACCLAKAACSKTERDGRRHAAEHAFMGRFVERDAWRLMKPFASPVPCCATKAARKCCLGKPWWSKCGSLTVHNDGAGRGDVSVVEALPWSSGWDVSVEPTERRRLRRQTPEKCAGTGCRWRRTSLGGRRFRVEGGASQGPILGRVLTVTPRSNSAKRLANRGWRRDRRGRPSGPFGIAAL